MQVDDRSPAHADEDLIRRAALGALGADARAELDRHVAVCPSCAAELEAMRMFHASLARDAQDDERDRAAVERAMARIGRNEAFDAIASLNAGSASAVRPIASRQTPSS